MKILVIDDEHSFGALLGHTLKRLGHTALVAAHPEDALAMLQSDVDAVITDIDMPAMNGVELARAIRERMPQMPVAFCTGSSPESKIVHEAQRMGRVLPKVWTVADVREVVKELALVSSAAASSGRRRRRSSISQLYGEPDTDASEASAAAPIVAAPPPQTPRRVRIAFKTWRQVRKVVADVERGPVYVTVPGPADLEPGTPVRISLALPGEITVRIAGEVQAVRPRAGQKPEVVIDLKGLDFDTAARLRALADASEGPGTQRETGYLRVSPRLAARDRAARGSDPPLARGSQDMRVSEILRDNRRLRDQIEGLASRMTPRPETEDN